MSKKSFFCWFSVFLLITVLVPIMSVKANNPTSMSFSYSSINEQLNVTITHNNGGTPGHFIGSVIIKVNAIPVKTEVYLSQPGVTFTYSYDNITANNGDTIEVTAICTFTGPFVRSFVVGSSAPEVPGYWGVMIIISISLLSLLAINYRRIKRIK